MPDTLKSICEQCPHLNNPQLDFIPSELTLHREIILRDLRELVSAASEGREKTVVVLAGTVLEAVLYSFIQSQQNYIAQRRGAFTFDPESSLQNYVRIFNRWFRDAMPGVLLPDVIVEYRNLVHFNRELNSAPGICAAAARDILRLLDALLAEFAGFAGSP